MKNVFNMVLNSQMTGAACESDRTQFVNVNLVLTWVVANRWFMKSVGFETDLREFGIAYAAAPAALHAAPLCGSADCPKL